MTILSGPGVEEEESTDRSATFTFTADVAGVTFHCWLDGEFNPAQPGDPSLPAPCASGQTYADLGLGDHLFAVRAVDQFGNLGIWEDAEFRIVPSEARITVGSGERDQHDGHVRVHERAARPGRGLLLLARRPPVLALHRHARRRLARHLPEDLHEPVPRRAHLPGPDPLHRSSTGRDCRSSTTRSRPSTPGRSRTSRAPDTIIDFGPPATTLSTSAYLQVSSDDPTATIECTLTGPAGTQQAECEPGVVTELTDLVPGDYTFSAVATDLSGNVDPSPATHAWTIGAPTGAPNTPVGDNVSRHARQRHRHLLLGRDRRLHDGRPARRRPVAARGLRRRRRARSTTSRRRRCSPSRSPSASTTTSPTFGGATPPVRLLHFDGELWLDVTTLHNPFVQPARLCSNIVEGFSLFAIALASSGMTPETSILSGPEGPLGPEGPADLDQRLGHVRVLDRPAERDHAVLARRRPMVLLRVARSRSARSRRATTSSSSRRSTSSAGWT